MFIRTKTFQFDRLGTGHSFGQDASFIFRAVDTVRLKYIPHEALTPTSSREFTNSVACSDAFYSAKMGREIVGDCTLRTVPENRSDERASKMTRKGSQAI
jgi:hypothetical protein